jgi:hypothetical protein
MIQDDFATTRLTQTQQRYDSESVTTPAQTLLILVFPYLFNVFCFSASLTNFLPCTINPFLFLTVSIYLLATFSLSANSPKSSKSSSVNGTQNGSSSRISYPWKISCGDAAPDVRLRISSEKPKDSATGRRDWIVKKGVPSLRASERTRPRRRVRTS